MALTSCVVKDKKKITHRRQETKERLHLIASEGVTNKSELLPTNKPEKLPCIKPRQVAPIRLPPPLQELIVFPTILAAVLLVRNRLAAPIRVHRAPSIPHPSPRLQITQTLFIL